MLVLSRKKGEELVIGKGADRVVVRVVGVRAGLVRLGIEARADTPVHRKEVYERKCQEQSKEAA